MKYNDVSALLHEERGLRLSELKRTGGVMLSAGCSGNWYFEWIEQTYGHVDRHIGVEFYSPMPDGLPSNVDWIANTVGDMHDVNSRSVDFVFSGQNLEHLWPSEVVNFYAESARITRPGGMLVVDSPNRNVTRPLVWSHPEHTVELTPLEACRMATLAGFDVTAVHGVWLVRDEATGRLLPLDPSGLSEQEVRERKERGRVDVDNALLWWVEAERSSRVCDVAALEREMRRIFTLAWPERCTRFVYHVGVDLADGARSTSEAGALIFGPYMPLPNGQYAFEFPGIRSDAPNGFSVGHCDVVAGSKVLFSAPLLGGPEMQLGITNISGPFELNESMTFGIQARVFAYAGANLTAGKPRLQGASPAYVLDTTHVRYEPAADRSETAPHLAFSNASDPA